MVDITAQWTEVWLSASGLNQTIATDPTAQQPGFNLPCYTTAVYCFQQYVASDDCALVHFSFSTFTSLSVCNKRDLLVRQSVNLLIYKQGMVVMYIHN